MVSGFLLAMSHFHHSRDGFVQRKRRMTKINVDELNEDGMKKLDSDFAWVMDLIRNSRLSVFMKNYRK